MYSACQDFFRRRMVLRSYVSICPLVNILEGWWLVSAVSTNLQILSSKSLHCCGVVFSAKMRGQRWPPAPCARFIWRQTVAESATDFANPVSCLASFPSSSGSALTDSFALRCSQWVTPLDMPHSTGLRARLRL